MLHSLANIMIPAVVFHVPVFVLAFVPIVLIEAYVVMRMCRGVTFGEAYWWSLEANIWSTLAGLPLVGCGLLATLEGLVLAPYQFEAEPRWLGPAMFLVELVPFFLVSWLIERTVIKRRVGGEWNRNLARAVLIGNAATYALIGVFWGIMLAVALMNPHG